MQRDILIFKLIHTHWANVSRGHFSVPNIVLGFAGEAPLRKTRSWLLSLSEELEGGQSPRNPTPGARELESGG